MLNVSQASCFLQLISSLFPNKDLRNLHSSLTMGFFLFSSDGASLFTDSLTVFILVTKLASSAYCCFMRKPQFPFDVILLEYEWSFSMSLLKLSLFTWSCFISNKIFLDVSNWLLLLIWLSADKSKPYWTSTISLRLSYIWRESISCNSVILHL